MVKYICISLLSIVILGGVFYYLNYDENFYRVCESPQKHENFKKLSIEEQFQTYLKYKCNDDSLPASYYWGTYIGQKEGALDFLLSKLHTENNEEVLNHTLRILGDTVRQQEIKGREDISTLVNQTIDKISDKDERDFVAIILGSKRWSRKGRLQNIAREIEERTKMSKEEYQEKAENEIKEKIAEQMKEVINQIKEKRKDEANQN